MIPRIIHYCWFGKKKIPPDALRCIDSWKKFFPSYQIIEWNELNFPLDVCDYVKEAYEAQQWAFVSDYARFWILYNYGGIYFDTDVEIIKPMDDLLQKGAIMGVEKSKDTEAEEPIAPGLCLATEEGNNLYKIIIENYNHDHFKRDQKGEYLTVVARITKILELLGYKYSKNVNSFMDVNIYPSDYFCPLNYWTNELLITDNTRTIHHYSATWLDRNEKKLHFLEQQNKSFKNYINRTWLKLVIKKSKLGWLDLIKFTFLKLINFVMSKK